MDNKYGFHIEYQTAFIDSVGMHLQENNVMNNIKCKSICFTGKLRNFTRNQARAMAVNAGMTIYETVLTDLDYLVMADPNSMSSKACKARRYGVKLISEDDFLKMMDLDKTKVEADTEYKKTHKEKRILDWKTCLDAICKKLGISCSKTTEPVYERGKDEKLVRINLYSDRYNTDLGDSTGIFRMRKYGGSKLEWTDDDRYVTSDDEAYRQAVWYIGTKAYKYRRLCSWERDNNNIIDKIALSYPDFGMPDSTEELKLKLEIIGWSIL